MRESFKYWLALNKVEGLGPVKLKKLLDQYGSAAAAIAALKISIPNIEEEIAGVRNAGAQVFTIEDQNYPINLRNIHDPPPILYVKGELKTADATALAIVGTRRATRYGLEIAREFAGQLVQMGITIVSGLALGIDAAAHAGALEADGRTIAVLGSGIDRIYPVSNRGLAAAIEKKGALISEFPIGQEPDSWTFPQRNRIISGLSHGVIVVEGHYDSGAMITAKLALDQGREVFAVPGKIGLEQSKGPHWLIKQGAKLVEGVEDVLEELNMVMPKKMTNDQLPISNDGIFYPELKDDEKKIVMVMSREPKHLDQISIDSSLPISQVSSSLMMLEIKKLIRQLPGKYFVLS